MAADDDDVHKQQLQPGTATEVVRHLERAPRQTQKTTRSNRLTTLTAHKYTILVRTARNVYHIIHIRIQHIA